MPIVSRAEIVPYSAKNMFNLVDTVEDYPKFLPWCHACEIFCRNEDEVKASLTIMKSGIRKSFATHNFLQAGKMIEIRLLSGPFRHLHGFWRFEDVDEQHSKISFDLEFEFSSKLISLALEPLFHQISFSLVDAFHQRANVLHGKKDVND
ncbi:MAG: type II toxin-antitoxin system RatA family toxin [Gammaproteobacteria bacterium]|nr:type II toxin-antitoxin system RatA family toxin [Gammaproteobacteria bacterium]